jgi:CheY-like chemotaxis protein
MQKDPSQASEKDEVSGERPLVLIIDDQPEYARLFELISDSLGIRSYIVNSCAEGLKALETVKVDIILMDWLMPDTDGPECACKIRKIEETAGGRVPIIGVSGYVKATRQECLNAGMDDYLAIPFTMEQLQATLSKWLKR